MNNLPTEAMIDAARPLFLALEAGATSIEDVREQMSHSGRTPIDHLPAWFRTGRGHLTKSGRAEIAWWLMRAQEPVTPADATPPEERIAMAVGEIVTRSGARGHDFIYTSVLYRQADGSFWTTHCLEAGKPATPHERSRR